MNNQILALVVAVAVALAGVYGFLWAFLKYRGLRNRFAPILDVENERARVASERDELEHSVTQTRANWEQEYSETILELEQLTKQLDQVRDQADMESFGVYETQYDLETSDQYKERLKVIRDQQKQMIKEDRAAVCETEWTVENSKVKGRQMTKRQLKLMLRAFNGESDAAVAKVRYNNVIALKQRIERSFEAVNKLGKSNHCEITPGYLELKQNELNLAHEYQEKRQEEKEEQRLIREQMREEELVRREIEKERAEAEKEETRYNEALERAREELEAAGDEKKAKLEEKLKELQKRLKEAQANKERALSRSQLTKSGHVYVISNVGSFGENVYKIGMTRRLDPQDRVKELGDASVPFGFDVHAMIYSENAPDLENNLHKGFNEARVNLVNNRKEFFQVGLNQIEEAVQSHGLEIEFTKLAEAEEFRKTEAIRAKSERGDEPPPQTTKLEDAKSRFERRRTQWGAGANPGV